MFSRKYSWLPKAIGFRLTLWYSTIFISSSLLLFTFVFFPLRAAILEKDRNLILEKLQEYVQLNRRNGWLAMLEAIRLEKEDSEESDFFVRVADISNRTQITIIPSAWPLSAVERVPAPKVGESRDLWTSLSGESGNPDLEIASRRLGDGYILQVGTDTEESQELLRNFRRIFAGIMLPVVLVGFTGGVFLALRSLRPVRDLIQTVRSIDTGRMDARVPSRQTGDELDELSCLFNAMLEKIEQLITGMRASLDNVAHDLRTPVTRQRAGIETALQSAGDAETLREALLDCAEESERIVTMLNTLMDISEAETGVMQLHLESINMGPFLEEVAELYQYVAEEKGVSVLVKAEPDLAAIADTNRLRQVIANLLDNAIKYTPAGGRVTITASQEGHAIRLAVEDTGIGIAAHDLPLIFDRLFRGDTSRSRRGLGLGLSLVKAVVEAHHARIEVDSASGKGSRFTIFWPLGSLAVL